MDCQGVGRNDRTVFFPLAYCRLSRQTLRPSGVRSQSHHMTHHPTHPSNICCDWSRYKQGCCHQCYGKTPIRSISTARMGPLLVARLAACPSPASQLTR